MPTCAEIVRTLCLYGAARTLRGPPHVASVEEKLAEEIPQILHFLQRTRGFLNPLEYIEDLSVEGARSWLRSEKLREFPRFDFMHRGSAACDLIEMALVWSPDAAPLFPASCRQRARELLFIPWQEKGITTSMVTEILIPYVIDRWGESKMKYAGGSFKKKDRRSRRN